MSGVQHVDDLNPVCGDAVNHDVIWMSDHLAGIRHPPRAEDVGVLRSRKNGLLDQGSDPSRGAWVVFSNMANDADETFAGPGAPDYRQHESDRLHCQALLGFGNEQVHVGHDLVVGNARAWIIQAGLHLRAKPAVVGLSLIK